MIAVYILEALSYKTSRQRTLVLQQLLLLINFILTICVDVCADTEIRRRNRRLRDYIIHDARIRPRYRPPRAKHSTALGRPRFETSQTSSS